jgi:hypothetical protein
LLAIPLINDCKNASMNYDECDCGVCTHKVKEVACLNENLIVNACLAKYNCSSNTNVIGSCLQMHCFAEFECYAACSAGDNNCNGAVCKFTTTGSTGTTTGTVTSGGSTRITTGSTTGSSTANVSTGDVSVVGYFVVVIACTVVALIIQVR